MILLNLLWKSENNPFLFVKSLLKLPLFGIHSFMEALLRKVLVLE
jgi:hypothetical protein